LLGNFSTYAEKTGHFVYDVYYWNIEFYAQDDWKVNKRLTLNYGVRFYNASPQIDKNQEFAYFDPSKFSLSASPASTSRSVTLARKIALGERREFQLKLEAFNVLNHVEFTGVNSGFTFTPCAVGSTADCISTPSGGFRNTNANIGALTGDCGPRILSLGLRFQF
jgi:hypothetical protein